MSCLSKTITVCLGVAGLTLAQMQPVVSGADGQGNVDWANRTIIATGIGAPNPNLPEAAQRPGAERAAQMIALRNALETVKGIFLNSATTIENFMTTSDVVSTRVSGFVKGFQQKGRTKYMSDGSVEITMEIPLDGFAMEVMGDQIGEKPSITKFEGEKSKKEIVFSGLIIDCKGLGIKPALSPKVLDEEGREVYGSAYISKEWAVKYGVVGYAKAVADAAKLERIGTTPGQIKAVKAEGQNSTDIVISKADAEDIRSAAKNLKFLSECRVIFVLD
jgi:hypothetical protein